MHLEDLIQRIDQLIQNADEVIETVEGNLYEGLSVDSESFYAFRTASLSFLAMTFSKDHTHYDEFNSKTSNETPYHTQIGRGILSVAQEELAGGWLTTTKGLVSAEIFSDFL